MLLSQENQTKQFPKHSLENQSCQPIKSQDYFKKSSANHHKNTFKQSNAMNFQNISDLALQYKLSLQYTPALGIYVLPCVQDFFNWQFYLFLRQGYYKDAKMTGQIIFDKSTSKKVLTVRFFDPVFHPIVDFKTGQVDIWRLLDPKTDPKGSEIFTILIRLKQMFIEDNFLTIKGSFNDQASKIYQKSEILFIEKVFESTVIPSEQFILRSSDTQIESGLQESLQLWNEDENKEDQIKQKLKSICTNPSKGCQSLQKNSLNDNEMVQQKVKRFLKAILQEKNM